MHIQREIEITSSLKHPNIIRIHEGESAHALHTAMYRQLHTQARTGGHAHPVHDKYPHTLTRMTRYTRNPTAAVCPLPAVFESRDKIVIVMEYASRGELYDYVHERRRLPETEARDVFRQITSAVHYCHKVNKYAHPGHQSMNHARTHTAECSPIRSESSSSYVLAYRVKIHIYMHL